MRGLQVGPTHGKVRLKAFGRREYEFSANNISSWPDHPRTEAEVKMENARTPVGSRYRGAKRVKMEKAGRRVVVVEERGAPVVDSFASAKKKRPRQGHVYVSDNSPASLESFRARNEYLVAFKTLLHYERPPGW